MFESICVVGERGQITLPKNIRKINGIKGKDKVIVKMENDKVIVEKIVSKMQKEKLMIEGYTKQYTMHKKINKEWENASKEANRDLDEY
ncbi:MAG: AbrB/MazE/SpoVT family DNA-binding domain-containing protein [Candidatus Diapherotrites archaeon]|nr:AbrB/MazE/SpoVT family DNA-binding domain-containing protein [Candidatus Diapherotrites archaeon]